MAEAARRPVEAWWYILPADRDLPAEKQSRFLLKPLTQAERMEAWDESDWVMVDGITGDRTVRPRGFRQARELVLRNLVDVQNFPASSPKPFPKDGTPAEKATYVDQFDDIDLFLIGDEIRKHSSLEREVKNS